MAVREIFNTYDIWSSLAGGSHLTLYHVWQGGAGTEQDHKKVIVIAANREFFFHSAVASGSADETDWDTNYKASSIEVETYENALSLGVGSPISGYDEFGDLKVVQEPRPGSEKYFFTHNLCDPCTWYEESIDVTEASAADEGDQITWDVTGHDCFIDLVHGRMFKEDNIPNVSDYYILVEVSTDGGTTWNSKTENTWMANPNDGDFTFNYNDGKVIFNSAIGASDQVRVTGKKKAGSTFTVNPAAGKRLKLEYVEVQYTSNISMNSNVVFEIYGYVQIFAPHLWDQYNPPGPYPTNTRIPILSESYKRIVDFFQESTGPFPVIPAHGGDYILEEVTGLQNIEDKLNAGYERLHVQKDGNDWTALMYVRSGDRAVKYPLITLPFKYLAFRDLRSSYGMQVRVKNNDDIAMGGDFANVTFYCTTEDE